MKNGGIKNEGPRGAPEILERVFRFGVEVVRFGDHLDRQPGVGRVLMSQIVRSGTSVGANMEEAQAAQSRADFVSKVSIALKEARETCFRLRVLSAAAIASATPPMELIREADEICRVLGAIVASARTPRVDR
jgi:four helix bundle protein